MLLGFAPSFLLGILKILINVRPSLLVLAIQADDGAGEIHIMMTLALPSKTPKQVKTIKRNIASILINFFLVVD